VVRGVARAAVAVACTLSAAGLGVLFASCGGAVNEAAPHDACGTSPDADARPHDAHAEEVGPSWWADVFDAASYLGFDPPVPGEYPPNGPGACQVSGCFIEGTCDLGTGWCCSGRMKAQQCACGPEAGCVPPSVCCALPGALQLVCVGTPDECPDAR
jgi:hypothetical protein